MFRGRKIQCGNVCPLWGQRERIPAARDACASGTSLAKLGSSAEPRTRATKILAGFSEPNWLASAIKRRFAFRQ